MLTQIKTAFDSIFTELNAIQDNFAKTSAQHAKELASLRARIKENIEAQTAYANGVEFLADGLLAIAEEARRRNDSTQYAFTDLLSIDDVADEPDQFLGYCANCGKAVCVTDDRYFEVDGELFCAECEEAANEADALAKQDDSAEE